MREYQSLGTAGGLYHFRDTILKGNPEQIFVLHADIASNFVRRTSHRAREGGRMRALTLFLW